MLIEVLSYKVKSTADIPLQYYMLENSDEEAFVAQLKCINTLKPYDVKELSVEIIDGGVLDYNMNIVRHPRLGLKMHVSKIVNDKRYGKVIKEVPFDMSYWLDA